MRGYGLQQHVPVEIMRTVVVISETGSLSKAAEKLGISQPAVSSQIKRLELLIGGELFDKSASGAKLTDLGKLVLHQARRMLEASDQVLRLGASRDRPDIIRVGLATLFAVQLLQMQRSNFFANMVFHTDGSSKLAKLFADGFVDVGCFFATPDGIEPTPDALVQTFAVPIAWVRSRDFVVSPGRPIPLIGWPGVISDDLMIRTLENRGLSYRIAFNSADYQARVAAAESGLGLGACPRRFLPPSLVVADELYLPELPPLTVQICARPGLTSPQAAELIEMMSDMFRDHA